MDVAREIVFPADPAEVWEALTEPERLEDWFANDVELEPVPAAAASSAGANGEERKRERRGGRPERLLTLRWEDDGGEVVFTLEPVPEGTRLVVVESSPEWSTALELARSAHAQSRRRGLPGSRRPDRRFVLETLADGSATATELAAALPVTRQAVAKHLGTLRAAELVEPTRRAGGRATPRRRSRSATRSTGWSRSARVGRRLAALRRHSGRRPRRLAAKGRAAAGRCPPSRPSATLRRTPSSSSASSTPIERLLLEQRCATRSSAARCFVSRRIASA